MPTVPRHSQITPGSLVSIVLKADQRTGRQVQGTVAQLLTRGDHQRGVKVRLADGRVGRVQQLVNPSRNNSASPALTQAAATSSFQPHRKPYSTMSSDQNPWANSQSQGNPYMDNPTSQHQQQEQYQAPPYPPRNQQQRQPPAPQQGIQRSDTDRLLASQTDGSAQVEQFQHYEQQASARETEDDRNQAALQKEFPNVDSSLIAALYSDNKNVSEVREMLQEIGSAN